MAVSGIGMYLLQLDKTDQLLYQVQVHLLHYIHAITLFLVEFLHIAA